MNLTQDTDKKYNGPANATQKAAQNTYPAHENQRLDAKTAVLKDNNDNNEFISSHATKNDQSKKEMAMDIGLDVQVRKEAAEQISILLSDTYQLYLKTQNFHWNVTGHMFGELHALFETQYRELAIAIDEIAENIRKMGHPTPATVSEFQSRTTIEDAVGVPTASLMIQDLVKGQESVLRTARALLNLATQSQNHGSADLAVRRIQAHEKAEWMLRSYLQDQ